MFLKNSPRRSKEELLKILKESQYRLSGLPISGYKIEMDWAEWIYEDIISKTDKLNNSNYKSFETNFLLIYDNLPHVANDINIQLKYLSPKIEEYWKTDNEIKTFAKIFIISGNFIIELGHQFENIRSIIDIWD